MARIEMDFETALPPDRVIAALTDFSDRRPDIWPSLAREFYEVRSVGETSAVVREGSSKPVKVWAVERYDWSTPGVVEWTVEESNFSTPGSFVRAEVKPGEGGGSRVHLTWNRTGATLQGRFIVGMLKLTGGRIIEKSVKQNLDKLAAGGPG